MLSQSMERVNKGRIQLVTSAPFWGSLALRLDMQEDATGQFETMATDGVRLIVNPSFADSLTDPELRGVLAHEVMHCALGHMSRRGARDPELWNDAADYAINLLLIDSGFVLPHGALINRQYDGMTAEAIYNLLSNESSSKNKPQSGQGKGTGQGAGQGAGQPQSGQGAGQAPKPQTGATGQDRGRCGQILDAPKGQSEKIGADWQGAAIQSAMIAAKQAGQIPGNLARIIAELRAPRVNWRDVLRDIVSDSMSRDYSWSRPNRRHIANGLYLPSLVSDGRGKIIVAIDTSGSLPDSALKAFSSELQAMLDEQAADSITVLYCDRAIHGKRDYESGEKIDLSCAGGGGGTAFDPVMTWTADNGADSSCLIYFTDLECRKSRFGDDPGLPVIWANWSSPKVVPFGQVIQLDPNQ